MNNTKFTSQMLTMAWRHTRETLGNPVRQITMTGIAALFGFSAYWLLRGFPTASDKLLSAALSSAAPVVLVHSAVFLWHLALVPFQILLSELSPTQMLAFARRPEPDYHTWSKIGHYSIREFAALLDNGDPLAGSPTPREAGIYHLIEEHCRESRLKYVVEYGENPSGDRYKKAITGETKIARTDALKWAQLHRYNVSKLEPGSGN